MAIRLREKIEAEPLPLLAPRLGPIRAILDKLLPAETGHGGFIRHGSGLVVSNVWPLPFSRIAARCSEVIWGKAL